MRMLQRGLEGMLSLHQRQDISAWKLQAFELRNSRASTPTNRSAAITHNPPISTRLPTAYFESTSVQLNNGCALHRCTPARWPRLFVQPDPQNCPIRRAATWFLPVCAAFILSTCKPNKIQLHRQRRINTRHLRRRLRHPSR